MQTQRKPWLIPLKDWELEWPFIIIQDARPFNSSINHVLLWFAPERDLALHEVTL